MLCKKCERPISRPLASLGDKNFLLYYARAVIVFFPSPLAGPPVGFLRFLL